jgi:hypothetical protein
MEFFYDGQIRRYISQTIRALSNFVVKYGDGRLVRIPVMYGDMDRQVANIISQNSVGNKVNSVPRIAVYISSIALDRERLSDATYVGKINVRERGQQIDTTPGSPTYGQLIYNQEQGRNYTVERIMPTPFKLTLKVDIWSSSTEQKLQILEQILVLFNPSLEIQTTDNYIDWTSLSVLNLNDINWSSRSVPVGADSPIEVATLTLETPAWLSPPAKVKRLGIVTKIINNVFHASQQSNDSYIEGLASDPIGPTQLFADQITTVDPTIQNNSIEVYRNQVLLLHPGENTIPHEPTLDPSPVRGRQGLSWLDFFAGYPGKYVAGVSTIYLLQPNGTYVLGNFAVNALDETKLEVTWNLDTLASNTGIDSRGALEGSVEYNGSGSFRPNSPGTFDAIINPTTFNPRKTSEPSVGTRYLIIEDIGAQGADNATEAWSTLVAHANDIIEWNGNHWNIIFNAAQETTTMVWQTNIYTSVQYLWDGVAWKKSFEGEYIPSLWKIVL